MMWHSLFIRHILLIVILLTSVTAHAWRPPTNKEVLIDRVLDLSGTRYTMRNASGQIMQAFHAVRELSDANATRRRMTPEQRETLARIQRVMRTTINQQAMYETVSAYLADNVTESQLAAAVKALQQRDVRRIVGMETRAMNTATPKALNEFAQTLRIRKPSPKRMAIVDHIDRITETSKHNAELMQEFAKTLMKNNPDRMQSMSDAIHRLAKNQSLLTLLYAYRELTDHELEAYAQIYQDENYAWVARMLGRARHKAARHVYEDFRESFEEWALYVSEAGRGPL